MNINDEPVIIFNNILQFNLDKMENKSYHFTLKNIKYVAIKRFDKNILDIYEYDNLPTED